jgi:hypothetical protein
VLTTTITLDNKQLPAALPQEFATNSEVYPENAQVEVLEPGKKWVLFNADSSYIISRTAPIAAPSATTALNVYKANEISPTFTFNAAEQDIVELNGRQISQPLQTQLEGQDVVFDAGLIVVIVENDKWLLAEESQTYYIEYVDDVFNIYKETSEPAGIVEGFLVALDALPDFGPAIDFLLLLVRTVLPFLLFAAVAALLLVIGHYTGVAVNGVVGVTGSAIPRTMAITSAVRNVSMALLIASEYFVQWRPDPGTRIDLDAIVIVLAFFVVSLAVAAHKAVQWGAEAAAEEPSAVVVANEGAGREPHVFNPRLL